MIKKNIIREDGYNAAIIEKIYQNGDVVVTLQQVEVNDEGVETILKQDANIVFEAGSFEFSKEELEELIPPQETNNLEI